MGCGKVIVLDTHVLIWLATDERPLGKQSREAYDRSFASGELTVSVVSYWELGMLVAKGRLGIPHALSIYRDRLGEAGVRELPVTGDIAILAAGLEGLHGDPADRFIAATALAHGATLMTADKNLLNWKYPLPRQNAMR
jgi:PIN domain nuclease of toxin-antitoxin system